MTSDVAVRYKVVGRGWAECDLDFYGATTSVSASYLSDALFELVRGTNHMLSGGNEARFSFDEEPGEYRWIMRREENGGLSLTILDFADLWGGKPDEDGDVLLGVTCTLRDFAHALYLSLNDLLMELGASGYRDKWGSDFPSSQYQTLCAHLGAQPSPHLTAGSGRGGI